MPIEFEFTNNVDESDEDVEEDADEVEKSDEEETDEEEINESEEFEEIEFSMTDGDIDEWICELIRLKNEKEPINLQIDGDLFLKINFEEEK